MAGKERKKKKKKKKIMVRTKAKSRFPLTIEEVVLLYSLTTRHSTLSRIFYTVRDGMGINF